MDGKNKTIGKIIDEIIDAIESLNANDQAIVLSAVSQHIGLSSLSSGTDIFAASRQEKDTTALNGTQLIDIRNLKEQKQPATAIEMACVVAYYLETLAPPADRKEEITSVDLEKFFKQAAYPLPKRRDQLLVDAKAAGYFDSGGRGKYRLNPVGHNLVVHSMPRSKK